jgi:hypothetical protein
MHLALRFVRRNELPAATAPAVHALPTTTPSWDASPWCSLRPVRRGPPGLALSAA